MPKRKFIYICFYTTRTIYLICFLNIIIILLIFFSHLSRRTNRTNLPDGVSTWPVQSDNIIVEPWGNTTHIHKTKTNIQQWTTRTTQNLWGSLMVRKGKHTGSLLLEKFLQMLKKCYFLLIFMCVLLTNRVYICISPDLPNICLVNLE